MSASAQLADEAPLPEASAAEDFVRAKAQEIEARLAEIAPLVHEYRRLEAALTVLTPPARRRRGRPPGGGDTRASQTVDLVRAQPGITITELAGRMGIRPNYLYRVLPQLANDGKVCRDGKGWRPASG